MATPLSPNAPRALPFSEREFRDAMAEFATGVTVICTPAANGRYAGVTANSFNSLSLDPPLVLWSLHHRAQTLPHFEQAERHAINVLAHDQVGLAERFSQPHEGRFAGVDFRLGPAGAPLIAGCVAWFECRQHVRQRIGDHVLFVSTVETCARGHGAGLVFHGGRFTTTRTIGAAESS